MTVALSKNGGPLEPRHDATAVEYDRDGCYRVTLDAEDTVEYGRLDVVVVSGAGPPERRSFSVMNVLEYDYRFDTPKVRATDANVTQWLGENVSAATAGYPEVTVKNGSIVAATFASGAIDANAIATNAITGLEIGTGAIDADAIAADAIGTSEFSVVLRQSIATYVDTELTSEHGNGQWDDTGSATLANQTTMITHLTDVKGTGFAKDTHSLPQCLTATGFSTFDHTTDGVNATQLAGSTGAATAIKDLGLSGIGTDAGILISTDAQDLSASLSVALSSAGLATSAANEIRTQLFSDGVALTTSFGSLSSVTNVGTVTGNVNGSVDSVTDPVTIVDGTGVGEIDTAGGAIVSVTTTGAVSGNVSGSVGSISGITFPTNFDDLAITSTTGLVSAGTVYDKTGYSISGTITTFDGLDSALDAGHGAGSWESGGGLTESGIADAVWDEAIAGHTTGSTFGGKNQIGVPSATLNDYKATGFSTHSANDVRDAVTGGAYSLDTDAAGRIRVVDGTGIGEINTSS
jgi:hypothetical protein